jgi:hypothetical protein
MGCLCSKGLTTAVQIEIPASCDLVWEVVTDLEALPETSPFVHAVEILNKDDNNSDSTASFSPMCVVGRKWREKRTIGRNEDIHEQIKTIVRIEQEPHRSLLVDVGFSTRGKNGAALLEDISNTCSWTVLPVSENDETVLICSIAFASADGTESCCRCVLLRYAEKYLLEELQGYKEAALKRQKEAKR